MRKTLLPLLILFATSGAMAQTDSSDNDLSDMLAANAPKKSKQYTTATFKATRIINGHSIENLSMGVLDFRIAHRFGNLDQGLQNFFGLDNATTKLGLDYGITDWLMIGLGHSTYKKENDGYVKIKILRQTDDDKMPLSVSYMGAMSVQTGPPNPPIPAGYEYYFSNRLGYVNQLLIARKFNEILSLQLMPTHIHYNLVDAATDKNNVLAAGIGGRIKLSHRIALTGEYYYVLPSTALAGYVNPASIGIDIETGGHVFQLHFTNATAMTERTFIGQTTDSWSKGQVHFGFNISRVFTIVKPKEFRNSRNKIW